MTGKRTIHWQRVALWSTVTLGAGISGITLPPEAGANDLLLATIAIALLVLAGSVMSNAVALHHPAHVWRHRSWRLTHGHARRTRKEITRAMLLASVQMAIASALLATWIVAIYTPEFPWENVIRRILIGAGATITISMTILPWLTYRRIARGLAEEVNIQREKTR